MQTIYFQAVSASQRMQSFAKFEQMASANRDHHAPIQANCFHCALPLSLQIWPLSVSKSRVLTQWFGFRVLLLSHSETREKADTSTSLWELLFQTPSGLSGLTFRYFLVLPGILRELGDVSLQIRKLLPFTKYMPPNTTLDIWLPDEAITPLFTPCFLVPSLLSGQSWRMISLSPFSSLPNIHLLSCLCTLLSSLFPLSDIYPKIECWEPMCKALGMNCLLRSGKLSNSSLLYQYEECMAKRHSPELSPTHIFPKCY